MGWAGGGVTNCGPQVPDGATVALVPCLTKHVLRESQDYVPGESEYLPSPPPHPCHRSPLPLLCPVSSNGVRSSGLQGGLVSTSLPPREALNRVPPLPGFGRTPGV